MFATYFVNFADLALSKLARAAHPAGANADRVAAREVPVVARHHDRVRGLAGRWAIQKLRLERGKVGGGGDPPFRQPTSLPLSHSIFANISEYFLNFWEFNF